MSVATEEAYAAPYEGLLHVDDAGRQLSCSRATVFRMIRAGDLGSVFFNRKTWVTQRSITDYFSRLINEASADQAQRRKAKTGGKRRSATRTSRGGTSNERRARTSSDTD